MRKYLILLAVFLLMIWGLVSLVKTNKALKQDNERLQQNIEYYSSFGQENIVLQHTVQELEQSKDSLIQHINTIQKKLDLKPKETKEIIYTETVIHDTIVQNIPATYNFSAIVRPNDLTTIEVTRIDTTLAVIPTIYNSQTIFIQTEKRYKYKNFFSRLIHFNFGKITTNRYYIDNSNDLIQVEDTRVIDVVK